MSRFFVPAVFVATISGLAFGLIVGIIARSPETHANVRPEGYDRTTITYLGTEYPFTGLGLAEPQIVTNADPGEAGRLLFLGYGCAACHGLTSQGGVLGPNLDPDELSFSEFRSEVRSGPKGMPSFIEGVVSDDDLQTIYEFLQAQHEGPTPSGGSE